VRRSISRDKADKKIGAGVKAIKFRLLPTLWIRYNVLFTQAA
jgi:hypothetical protein